ncbi:MAG: type II toxin-antitoxin system PemK/MazF family toxin [Bryobacteraceae bacterium]|nr:type II toxin-antitoxin system PemK/MazF family toxin [Bryobacteraceae bacterium]
MQRSALEEVWWANLGAYRLWEQTGRRPVVIWQSQTLTRVLQSVLVVPLTTNLDRARLAGTALIHASSVDGPPEDSVALAFQMRAIPKCSNKASHGAQANTSAISSSRSNLVPDSSNRPDRPSNTPTTMPKAR